MNILLVGEESAGAQTLKLLSESGHKLVGVMASPTRKGIGGLTVWQHAQKLGCRTWPAELVKDPDFAEVIRNEKVDLLLNVHSLFVIANEIVEAPLFGSFNLHPGPLPRYAGLNAPSWAIYHGERSHGVTLHKMLAGIDTGPIAYQKLFDIEDTDTGFTVSLKCIKAGMELISSLLDAASTDPASIPLKSQDLSLRSYFGRKTPENGRLDWSRPAHQIVNFIRAADYSPFPSPWSTPKSALNGREIGFIKAEVTDLESDAVPGTIGRRENESFLIAGDDKWVRVRRISVADKPVNPADFLVEGMKLE